jgi:hypothetical protein
LGRSVDICRSRQKSSLGKTYFILFEARRLPALQNPWRGRPTGVIALALRPRLEVSVTRSPNAVVEQIGMAPTNTSRVTYIRWRTG